MPPAKVTQLHSGNVRMSDIQDPDSGSLLLREHSLQRLMAVDQDVDAKDHR